MHARGPRIAAATAVAMTLMNAAQAAYDFESLADGLYNSIVLVDNGITATFTNPTGTQLRAWDLTPFGRPASWGDISLWTNDVIGPTTVNFSQGLSFASFEFGDYVQDTDLLFLNAFSGPNGTGSLLDSVTFNWGLRDTATGDLETLSVLAGSSQSILSLTFGSIGNAQQNNIFVDNISVRPSGVPAVPEPFTMGLAALGLGVALKRRRK